MVEKYLKDNGFDGLYCAGECGCQLSDLIPCDGDFSGCEPGYKNEKVEWNGEEVDWVISGNKVAEPASEK